MAAATVMHHAYMYVCMYVCMYVYMYTHASMHVYMYVYVYMYSSINMYVLHLYFYMYSSINIYTVLHRGMGTGISETSKRVPIFSFATQGGKHP